MKFITALLLLLAAPLAVQGATPAGGDPDYAGHGPYEVDIRDVVVKRPGAKDALIPAIADVVQSVDLEAGLVHEYATESTGLRVDLEHGPPYRCRRGRLPSSSSSSSTGQWSEPGTSDRILASSSSGSRLRERKK